MHTLGRKITFGSLIRFALPTVFMLVFSSLYTIIDGIFISNFVGEDGLSGLNIVFPVINIIMGIATMFATGGSAIVAKKMGEGKKDEANQNFTFLFIVLMAVGTLVTIGVLVFIDPLLSFLGAIETLYTYSYDYLFTTVMFTLVTMAKLYFDFFLVTSGKANLALINSVIGGVTNVILDYVFMGSLNMGMAGAAYATEIAMILPVILSFIYFASKKLTICFTKPKAGIKLVLSACANGSSEMVIQISAGISTFLFNLYMLQYIGKTGVAAVTIVMYSQFLLISMLLGFSAGISPLISFNYGQQNHMKLNKIVKYSYIMVGIFAVVSFAAAQALAIPITTFFAHGSPDLYQITIYGFRIFSFSFLICGFNILTSGLFTALSNGLISALVSSFRTLIFFVIGMVTLPLLFGVTGIWLVVPIAEVATLIASIVFLYVFKNKYGYSKQKSQLFQEQQLQEAE